MFTLPKFHVAPEKLPKPNRKGLSSNHHFSGASLLVWGMVTHVYPPIHLFFPSGVCVFPKPLSALQFTAQFVTLLAQVLHGTFGRRRLGRETSFSRLGKAMAHGVLPGWLMVKKSGDHQLIWQISYYLHLFTTGFIHSRWLGMGFLNIKQYAWGFDWHPEIIYFSRQKFSLNSRFLSEPCCGAVDFLDMNELLGTVSWVLPWYCFVLAGYFGKIFETLFCVTWNSDVLWRFA